MPLPSRGGILDFSFSLTSTASRTPSGMARVNLEGFRGKLKASSREAVAGSGLVEEAACCPGALAPLRGKVNVTHPNPA